ncbi:hypothetical protein ACVBGC_32170 [Burkholderia stagnalis]
MILFSLFSAILLVIGGLLCALVPSLRRRIGRSRKLGIGLLVAIPVLLVASVPVVFFTAVGVLAWRSADAPESAHHVTLERARVIAGFDMPPGTRLDLTDAHDPGSFKHATFPRPIPILGVATTAMTSVLPYSIVLTGPGEQVIDGWNCDATHDIKFSRSTDRNFNLDANSPFRFDGCTLGAGNRIANDLVVPARAYLGAALLEDDAFSLRFDEPLAIGPGGAQLESGALLINRTTRIMMRIEDGKLMHPLKWGNATWPAGTQVSWQASSPGEPLSAKDWHFFKP